MDSLSLNQAIERYASSEDWKKYLELEKFKADRVVLATGYRTPAELKCIEFWAFRDRLQNDLRQMLSRGELVASAFAEPLRPESARVPIPADKWRLLKVDFENSRASGHGLSLIDITVGEADSPAPSLQTRTARLTLTKFPGRAAWLKGRLAEKQWTKYDLAEASGVDRRTLQKILDGKPVVENTIDKLEEYFKQRPPAD